MKEPEFRNLLERLATGWSNRDYTTVSDAFSEHVRYADPLRCFFTDKASLRAFFKADDGREQHTWFHTVIFDEQRQQAAVEYTYEGTHRYHGVALIRLEHGLITHWREYQHVDPRDWMDFIQGKEFPTIAPPPPYEIRATSEEDRAWATAFLADRWESPTIVTRGHVHHADRLPGFIAFDGDTPRGLVTYAVENGECEVVSLDSLDSNRGIGTALVKAVLGEASARHCRRLWLITTNDNTGALRFYQKIGFEFAAIHRNAVARSRELKPGIPTRGTDGIPIRDELDLELEIRLDSPDKPWNGLESKPVCPKLFASYPE